MEHVVDQVFTHCTVIADLHPAALQRSIILRRPNVHAIGWRPQASLPGYYQAFDVILIPYLREHPFNQVCSPTKIMDGMGSGRPIVATAIPECRLYSELFAVAEDADAFLDAVESIRARGSDDGRAVADVGRRRDAHESGWHFSFEWSR